MPPVDARATAFDAACGWALHPQVTLRPEPFGALAYHFGTRRLSFLKSLKLVAVVERLGEEPTAADACRAAGVGPGEQARYEQALAALAASGMILRRDERRPGGPWRPPRTPGVGGGR
jgi:putative mycofactocin binding protein MftB